MHDDGVTSKLFSIDSVKFMAFGLTSGIAVCGSHCDLSALCMARNVAVADLHLQNIHIKVRLVSFSKKVTRVCNNTRTGPAFLIINTL
jgi:hypothetical protein